MKDYPCWNAVVADAEPAPPLTREEWAKRLEDFRDSTLTAPIHPPSPWLVSVDQYDRIVAKVRAGIPEATAFAEVLEADFRAGRTGL